MHSSSRFIPAQRRIIYEPHSRHRLNGVWRDAELGASWVRQRRLRPYDGALERQRVAGLLRWREITLQTGSYSGAGRTNPG